MSKKILIVVAHPDDEVLGCGGVIAKHVSEGDEVSLIVLADGVTSRGSSNGVEVRNSALKNSCKHLGISHLNKFNFPDNKMDTIPFLDIVKTVENCLRENLPDIIYTHSFFDLNIDHIITHKVVMTACRPQFGDLFVPEILSFYTPSSTEWSSISMNNAFKPNKFVEISPFFSKKVEALKFYDLEMRDYPHPRSYEAIEATAKYFGSLSGLKMAECFFIERIIKR